MKEKSLITTIVVAILLACLSCPQNTDIVITGIEHTPDPAITGDTVTFTVHNEPESDMVITYDLDNNGTFSVENQAVFHFFGEQTIEVKAEYNSNSVT